VAGDARSRLAAKALAFIAHILVQKILQKKRSIVRKI
jgi:hypothetical protein